ncbi:MAG: D-alanine--D-alanine ligase [Syntrophales bacterium]
MKVVVLHSDVTEDAGIDEKDALVQAAVVSSALSELGYEPIAIPFSLNCAHIIDMLRDLRPVFVFNIVETMAGQGSLIHVAPSVLDFLRIPYTGATTEATFLTSHKVLAKKMLNAAGIATPPLFLPHENYHGHFVEDTYIIKAVWEHASTWLGGDSIIHARNLDRLREATASRQKQIGMACFAEAFIEGREFNLSLLAGDGGPQVLPPAEIRFDDFPPGKVRVVDYLSKWVEDSFEYHHTPRCFDFPEEDAPLLLRLKDLALQCWRVFGLRGYARVDFRIDNTGTPWVLEVNTNPCLSPDGGFYAALERSGLSFVQTIERIIRDAVSF